MVEGSIFTSAPVCLAYNSFLSALLDIARAKIGTSLTVLLYYIYTSIYIELPTVQAYALRGMSAGMPALLKVSCH